MKIDSNFTITIKEIIDENFQDYKKASMFIATSKCDFKCMKELGLDCSICQNMPVSKMPNKSISIPEIFKRYKNNPLTSAIVIGGLEPILQFDEMLELISYFRKLKCNDDFVIYTGYYENEIKKEIQLLREFKNIIIKYGRFIPNSEPIYDAVLGVTLNSGNQHAVKIS
ncbi:MAG: 4Fe-4S cluster-binding domain-containing protein [Acutalibacteraceae bacterium]